MVSKMCLASGYTSVTTYSEGYVFAKKDVLFLLPHCHINFNSNLALYMITSALCWRYADCEHCIRTWAFGPIFGEKLLLVFQVEYNIIF